MGIIRYIRPGILWYRRFIWVNQKQQITYLQCNLDAVHGYTMRNRVTHLNSSNIYDLCKYATCNRYTILRAARPCTAYMSQYARMDMQYRTQRAYARPMCCGMPGWVYNIARSAPMRSIRVAIYPNGYALFAQRIYMKHKDCGCIRIIISIACSVLTQSIYIKMNQVYFTAQSASMRSICITVCTNGYNCSAFHNVKV